MREVKFCSSLCWFNEITLLELSINSSLLHFSLMDDMPATEMLNTSDHLNHQPASTQPVHQLGGQLRCTWSTLVTSPSRPVTVTSSNIIITSMLSSHFNRWPRYTSPVLGSHVTVRPMPSCSNFLRCRSSRRLHFCIKFQRDVGQLLFDVTNDFTLG